MGASDRPDVAREESRVADLAALVLAQGLATGRTVATAESCTGGLIAAALTAIPGASASVVGGIVAYADRAKTRLLGVPSALIKEHGAVSAEVAVAMAEGARSSLGADLTVAVTGISGPSGGSPTKPVGLTFVAAADADGTIVERHQWTGDRASNRRETTVAALRLLLGRLGYPDS